MFTPAQACIAITARINGEFHNEELKKIGALMPESIHDVCVIIGQTIIQPVKLRVLRVTVVPGEAAVVIRSEYYKQSIRVPFTNEPGSDKPKVDTALNWCKENGFNVLGYENADTYAYIITDTDKSIK